MLLFVELHLEIHITGMDKTWVLFAYIMLNFPAFQLHIEVGTSTSNHVPQELCGAITYLCLNLEYIMLVKGCIWIIFSRLW